MAAARVRRLARPAGAVVAAGELTPGRGGFRIPVRFAIPSNIPHRPIDDEVLPGPIVGSRTVWVLSVDATFPGLDYRAEFEVPVFAVSA